MSLVLLIVALILFQLLVILHEYGHFLVAKRNKVKVKEFGLGFPPKIIGRKMGKGIFRSYYTLNLLPLGGFVRLEGENDEAKEEGTYGACSLWVKTKILLAGVFVNFLIAVFLFTVLALVGIPKLLPTAQHFDDEQFSLNSDTHIVSQKTLVNYVQDDTPAQKAQLQLNDEIVALVDQNTQKKYLVDSVEDLQNHTRQLAGQPVIVQIKRDDQPQNIKLTLNTNEQAQEMQKGRLGVATWDYVIQRNTWSAPITGVALTVQFTKVTFQGLGQAIGHLFQGETEKADDYVTGPVGIFAILQAGANDGIRMTLMIVALISLALATFNTLPIPALDGGRLALTLFFHKVLRKPLTKTVETRIVGFSMLFLLTFVVLITIVDINRFFLN